MLLRQNLAPSAICEVPLSRHLKLTYSGLAVADDESAAPEERADHRDAAGLSRRDYHRTESKNGEKKRRDSVKKATLSSGISPVR